mmetsp:Transcript_47906/g.111754  ORF Transcript_47906/g.111754 Transcript_47906/m.111754 type:complete len:125 (-) Transcript_47906:147-521(-)
MAMATEGPGGKDNTDEDLYAGTRLRLPAFEWYLGPMYQRYGEILAEREKAKSMIVTTKKAVAKSPPEPPWVKHTTPRMPVHRFAGASYERPLMDQGLIHIHLPRQATPSTAPNSARSTRRTAWA